MLKFGVDVGSVNKSCLFVLSQLLQAVKKSDVVKVNAIFEDNPNMNLRYIDDVSYSYCTTLHRFNASLH